MRTFYLRLDQITEFLGIVFLMGRVAVIFIQVIFRYFLNDALPWPEEAGRYLFLWATYLGISICMGKDSHLRVALLPESLGKAGEKVVNLLVACVNIFFFAIVVYLGLQMTGMVFTTGQTAIALPVPIWVVWAGIPLFCFFALLQALKAFRLIWMARPALLRS